MDIDSKVKEIKRSFRLLMDGATAQSMRQKGVNYKLNWGATLPRLREMVTELTAEAQQTVAQPDDYLYHLSVALWKEDVRECKILATMLMPPRLMLPEMADLWMEQITQVEIAEQAAFNVFHRLPYAAEKAFLWIASADDLPQLCGYHILSRLFINHQEPNERGINEFIDQALSALHSTNASLRKAAMLSIQHFADMGLVYERIARSATRQAGFDFLL